MKFSLIVCLLLVVFTTSAAGADNSLAQAQSLALRGNFQEAQVIYERIVLDTQQRLGADHPAQIPALVGLGQVYAAQGKLSAAEQVLLKAISMIEKLLGRDHTARADALIALSVVRREKGDLAAAEAADREAVQIGVTALGPHHPTTLGYQVDLAVTLAAMGRYREATAVLETCIPRLKETLSAESLMVLIAQLQLASIYNAIGRIEDADRVLAPSIALFLKSFGENHVITARAYTLLALLHNQLGRDEQSEAYYKKAIVSLETVLGPNHPSTIEALAGLAALYYGRGRISDGESVGRRALELIQTAPAGDGRRLVLTFVLRSMQLGNDKGLDGALSLASRLRSIPDRSVAAVANYLLGSYQHARGHLAEAESVLKQGLTLAERELDSKNPLFSLYYGRLAEVAWSQGRAKEAEALTLQSLANLEHQLPPEHPEVALSRARLAKIYAATGRGDQATAELVKVTRSMSAHLSRRQNTGALRALIAQSRQWRPQIVELLLLADNLSADPRRNGRVDTTTTFELAQLARISATAHAVEVMAARFASPNESLMHVIREQQDAVAQWESLDSALNGLLRLNPDVRVGQSGRDVMAEMTILNGKIDDIGKRIAAEFPAYAELTNARPVELVAAQQLLAPDEALLVYLIEAKESFVWVVRRENASMLRLGVQGDDLSQRVNELRHGLEPESNRSLRPYDARLANLLYRMAVGPVEPHLAGVHHIFVVPDGVLQRLPLGVLTTSERNDSDAWLIQKYSISVLPAVSSLAALRGGRRAPKAAMPFIGIGDPLLEGNPQRSRRIEPSKLYRGGSPALAALRQLMPLPETAAELAAIAASQGVGKESLLLREKARKPFLRQFDLSRYRIIAFATHALVAGDFPGLAEPALVMTPPSEISDDDDGLLKASDIVRMNLNAEWVILSACNTAAPDGAEGAEGLSGLAKAFLYAGARTVLASHWPVVSDAAVRLTSRAFSELASDPSIGRSEAMRRSMLVFAASGKQRESHPMLWGPFVVVGDGGRQRTN
jgi:CHAT domain-containing protein